MFHVRAHEDRRAFKELDEDRNELLEKYRVGRAIAKNVNVVPQFCCDIVLLLDLCVVSAAALRRYAWLAPSGAEVSPTKIRIA